MKKFGWISTFLGSIILGVSFGILPMVGIVLLLIGYDIVVKR